MKLQYEALVDINARYRNRAIVYEKQTYYGQLKQVLQFDLAPVPECDIPNTTPLIVAVIQVCNIDADDHNLDIHYYTRLGAVQYVDITTVQCVVGRIKDRGRYAIIDRSGSLSCALYTPENGEES